MFVHSMNLLKSAFCRKIGIRALWLIACLFFSVILQPTYACILRDSNLMLSFRHKTSLNERKGPYLHVGYIFLECWGGNKYVNIEKKMVEDINYTRADKGIPPLVGYSPWMRHQDSKWSNISKCIWDDVNFLVRCATCDQLATVGWIVVGISISIVNVSVKIIYQI